MRSGPVRVSYVSISAAQPQLAFAIGRRFGNAVARNRARRRLRAAFSAAWATTPSARPGAYLVMADRAVLAAPFSGLEQAFRSCLVKVEQRTAASAGEPGVVGAAGSRSGSGRP